MCCGAGRHARALAGAGYDVLGIDLSPELVAEAARATPRARFQVLDMRDVARLEGSFDGILNVVADTCPDTGTFSVCLDGADSPEPPTVTFPASAGEDYYLIYDGWGSGCGPADFSIVKQCIRETGICDTLACDAVDNCGIPCGCDQGETCTAGECVATPGESCAAPNPPCARS